VVQELLLVVFLETVVSVLSVNGTGVGVGRGNGVGNVCIVGGDSGVGALGGVGGISNHDIGAGNVA